MSPLILATEYLHALGLRWRVVGEQPPQQEEPERETLREVPRMKIRTKEQ